jgi:hypothetical protein
MGSPPFNGSGSTSRLANGSSDDTSSGPSTSSSPAFGGMDLAVANWPSELPPPDVLKHLLVASMVFFELLSNSYFVYRVEVFFLFHTHAARLFHTGTFMACLALPPAHPKFPATPVLHAICALGSLYTAAVTSPPQLDFDELSPGK